MVANIDAVTERSREAFMARTLAIFSAGEHETPSLRPQVLTGSAGWLSFRRAAPPSHGPHVTPH
eukprot:2236863-Prymnesium_polylepis.1